MKGGAWPYLVGGVICLVNSDNERDLLTIPRVIDTIVAALLDGPWLGLVEG